MARSTREATSAPSGAGLVMWCASEPIAHPASSATGVAARARAAWSRSSTRKPDPSPRLVPRRLMSKGRHGSGSIAPSALKPLSVSRHSPSLPPASTASTSPVSSHEAATTIALAPLEQALARVRMRANGPRRSPRRSPVAVSGCEIIAARASRHWGSACRRASSSSVSNIPPVVPPTTSPTRLERTSSFAERSASSAAMAAITLVRDQPGPGARTPSTSAASATLCPSVEKSRTGRMARSPRTSGPHVASTPAPSGVTSPSPVTHSRILRRSGPARRGPRSRARSRRSRAPRRPPGCARRTSPR